MSNTITGWFLRRSVPCCQFIFNCLHFLIRSARSVRVFGKQLRVKFSHMHVKLSLVAIGLITMLAGKYNARVGELMRIAAEAALEPFRTVAASIRPVVGMYSFVYIQRPSVIIKKIIIKRKTVF